MKHFSIKTFLTTILLFSAASLVACNSNKLPTNSYDKVKFAFNGVAKSFEKPKAAKKSLAPTIKSRLGGSNPDGALATIYNLFTASDQRDDFLDDVEYNQPPMVQFQYLKKVLEKVGSGYEFGTKYSDTVTGDVYLDITTGFESNKETDKFSYTFGLAMDINIDNNDLITADVSFDIKLARGQEAYKSKWYVAIELDYDMKNSSPNYTMTMVTENDERELPYYNHYTYEYDYVEVKNSAINEWRKFCMDNNNRLIKDSAHPNFDSYTGEGTKYKVDACSWYKDGTYYKNKRTRELNGSEAKTVGEALYNGLGLNATEINADAFFNKTSTQNSVLKTCYAEFCKIAKKDIIYSLLTKEEQSSQNEQQKAGIKAMNADLSGVATNYHISGSTTLGQLFTGFSDFDMNVRIRLIYVNQNGGDMDEITDLNSLTYFFKVRNNPNMVMFDDFNETLESAYNKLLESGQIGNNDIARECEIAFTEKANPQIAGAMMFYYSSDLPSIYSKPAWPEALMHLGIPEYDGEKVTYDYKEETIIDGKKRLLTINDTTYDEGEAYCRKLRQNSFQEALDRSSQDEVVFYKEFGDTQNLYVSFRYSKSSTSFLLSTWNEAKPYDDPPQGDTQPFHVYILNKDNNWGKNGAAEFDAEYNDGFWTFILRDYHVEAYDEFAFVENYENPEAGVTYGYQNLADDPRGFFEPDNAGGRPYAMIALKPFTATFTVYEDRTFHVTFNDTQGEIQYLTVVGSFNGWEVNDGAIELQLQSNGTFKNTFTLDADVQFKIMQDHSWTINYGYNDITALHSADMKHRFAQEAEHDNIITLIPMQITLIATVSNGQAKFNVDIRDLG